MRKLWSRAGRVALGLWIAAGLTACATAGDASIAPAEKPDVAGKTVIVPVKGTISSDSLKMKWLLGADSLCVDTDVIKAIDDAEQGGATRIVIEVDSLGGEAFASEAIAQRIIQSKVPTVAVVVKNAISGGSMVATACKTIVMAEGSTIGACEPHGMGMEIPEAMREKIESVIRARMRANAQANGHPDKLLESMVTKSLELWRVTYKPHLPPFPPEMLYANELDTLRKSIEKKEEKAKVIDQAIRIVAPDRLLTLTAKESLEYGLAAEVVTSAADYYATLENMTITLSTETVDEPMSIAFLMILILCLVIGVAGVVVEVNVPGFGMPGVVGIIGFASFFTILMLDGRAEWWESALFVVGVGLVLAELFIIPGFGVAGILGVTCIVAAIIFGVLPPIGSKVDWWNEGMHAGTVFGLGSLGACILLGILFTYLERIPVLRRMVMTDSLKSGREAMSDALTLETRDYPHEAAMPLETLMGLKGVATTVLRPSGKMRTEDGRTFDVISESGMVAKDANVVIVDVNGPRISVRVLDA